MTPVRVVLDTNCLVSALIFTHGNVGQLRLLWQRKAIIPVVCRETVRELLRVLGYPKFNLNSREIESLLADILPWTETVEVPLSHDIIAQLRDRNDAIFVRLAQIAHTDFLVSGDTHLLELHSIFPTLNIVSPVALLEFLRINTTKTAH